MTVCGGGGGAGGVSVPAGAASEQRACSSLRRPVRGDGVGRSQTAPGLLGSGSLVFENAVLNTFSPSFLNT